MGHACLGVARPAGVQAVKGIDLEAGELPCVWTDPLGSPFNYKQIPTAGPPKCRETPSLQTLEVHQLLGHATASAFENVNQVGPWISWGALQVTLARSAQVPVGGCDMPGG